MTETPPPDRDHTDAADGEDQVTPNDLAQQAVDPGSDKRTTGEAQAAANREDEPPA